MTVYIVTVHVPPLGPVIRLIYNFEDVVTSQQMKERAIFGQMQWII